MSNWYVYILRCNDQSLYTGITTDPGRRLKEHNYGKNAASYTRARRPVRLVYREKCNTRSQATKREIEIKALKKEDKEKLLVDRT